MPNDIWLGSATGHCWDVHLPLTGKPEKREGGEVLLLPSSHPGVELGCGCRTEQAQGPTYILGSHRTKIANDVPVTK